MLTIALNVPTTHNRALFTALRDCGVDLDVHYRALAASTGRSWEPTPEAGEAVDGALDEVRRAIRRARRPTGERADVLLSGGWAHPLEVLRRGLAPLGARSVHWWGERLAPTSSAATLARRAFLAAPGLTGVLAVGTAAVHGYDQAVGGRVPVHVLPYVTDRGLDRTPAPAADPIVGYVGRLVDYKGPDLAIDAVASLPAGTRLEIVGEGPLRASLGAAAARAGVDAHFLGAMHPEALDERRRAWWVQVVPNRAPEGWGLAVNEALGAGVPVVATAYVASGADLVEQGRNGAIAEEATPDALAAAIAPFLEAAVQRRAAVAARRSGVAFAAAHAAEWLVALLRELPAEPRSFVTYARGLLAAAEGDTR